MTTAPSGDGAARRRGTAATDESSVSAAGAAGSCARQSPARKRRQNVDNGLSLSMPARGQVREAPKSRQTSAAGARSSSADSSKKETRSCRFLSLLEVAGSSPRHVDSISHAESDSGGENNTDCSARRRRRPQRVPKPPLRSNCSITTETATHVVNEKYGFRGRPCADDTLTIPESSASVKKHSLVAKFSQRMRGTHLKLTGIRRTDQLVGLSDFLLNSSCGRSAVPPPPPTGKKSVATVDSNNDNIGSASIELKITPSSLPPRHVLSISADFDCATTLAACFNELSLYNRLESFEIDSFDLEWDHQSVSISPLVRSFLSFCQSNFRSLRNLALRCRLPPEHLLFIVRVIPPYVERFDISKSILSSDVRIVEALVELIARNSLRILRMTNCGVQSLAFRCALYQRLDDLNERMSLDALEGMDFSDVPDLPPKIAAALKAHPIQDAGPLLEFWKSRTFGSFLEGKQVRVWWHATQDERKTDFSGRYWPAKVLRVNPVDLVVTCLYDNAEIENVKCNSVQPLNTYRFGGGVSPCFAEDLGYKANITVSSLDSADTPTLQSGVRGVLVPRRAATGMDNAGDDTDATVAELHKAESNPERQTEGVCGGRRCPSSSRRHRGGGKAASAVMNQDRQALAKRRRITFPTHRPLGSGVGSGTTGGSGGVEAESSWMSSGGEEAAVPTECKRKKRASRLPRWRSIHAINGKNYDTHVRGGSTTDGHTAVETDRNETSHTTRGRHEDAVHRKHEHTSAGKLSKKNDHDTKFNPAAADVDLLSLLLNDKKSSGLYSTVMTIYPTFDDGDWIVPSRAIDVTFDRSIIDSISRTKTDDADGQMRTKPEDDRVTAAAGVPRVYERCYINDSTDDAAELEAENGLPLSLAGAVLRVGEICEFCDVEEYSGLDPSDFVGVVVGLNEAEPVYLVKYVYQDEESVVPLSTSCVRRAIVADWVSWRDWVLAHLRAAPDPYHVPKFAIKDEASAWGGDTSICVSRKGSKAATSPPLRGPNCCCLLPAGEVAAVSRCDTDTQLQSYRRRVCDSTCNSCFPWVHTRLSLVPPFELVAPWLTCSQRPENPPPPSELKRISKSVFSEWWRSVSSPRQHPVIRMLEADVALQRMSMSELQSEVTRLMQERTSLAVKAAKHPFLVREISAQRKLIDEQKQRITELEDEFNCLLCHDKKRNCLLKPCMHWYFCHSCAASLKVCPICRKTISKTLILTLDTNV